MRELRDLGTLGRALREARDLTLEVYAHLDPGALDFPYLRTVNPGRWELAHVAWFEELWCLREGRAEPSRPTRLELADAMFDSRIVPHITRWALRLPDYARTCRYLREVGEDVVARLPDADGRARYFATLALYHEDMHLEAMLMTLQTLALPAPALVCRAKPAPRADRSVEGDARFEGGAFALGAAPEGADFVFDNEKWAHDVRVEPFAMSRRTVTHGEFAAFVEDRGYERPELWSDSGWAWREARAARAPVYWRRDGGGWSVRRYADWEPLAPDEPVVHVSRFEAEAWCRWAGRRLPTEAEWELAARGGRPTGEDRFPWGAAVLPEGAANLDHVYARPVPAGGLPDSDGTSGLAQMLGNVWEWTASAFEPYPGFSPDAYAEYSAPWFGDHAVIRGGSFATRSRLVHNRFRNFYTPDRHDMFVGFRTCALRA